MDHPPAVPTDLTGITTLGRIGLYRRQKKWVERCVEVMASEDYASDQQIRELNEANCVLQFVRSSITIPIRD